MNSERFGLHEGYDRTYSVESSTSNTPITEISGTIITDDNLQIVIFGFLTNIRDINDKDSMCKIVSITARYYVIETVSVAESKPLYLIKSDIPAPPNRSPPQPPIHQKVHTPMVTVIPSRPSSQNRRLDFFEVYQSHLERIEFKIASLDSETDAISSFMNNTLLILEQRRIEDISTIQSQFNSTITALCYQINNQLNNQIRSMSKKSAAARIENANRINELEDKLAKLQQENDTLRRQDKISKILKLQTDESEMQMSENEAMRKWLGNTVRLPQYAELILSAGIDLETIGDITLEELERLGIDKIGHRKKIKKYAAKLSPRCAPQRGHEYSPNSANGAHSFYSHKIWSDDNSVHSSTNNIWSYRSNSNQAQV